MADHSKPTTTDTYANVLTYLDGRLDDLAVGLDPAVVTPTNVPTNAIRWNSAGSNWQKWNGATWGNLAATFSFPAISVTGNTTLGDAAGDTLTINAGTHTLNNNITATRAVGTHAAGVTNNYTYAVTGDGEAGGTSNPSAFRITHTLSGANNFIGAAAANITAAFSGSGTLGNLYPILAYSSVTGNGTVTNNFGISHQHTLGASTSGSVTSARSFCALNPSINATATGTLGTLYSYQSSVTGHAQIGNFYGFIQNDLTTNCAGAIQAAVASNIAVDTFAITNVERTSNVVTVTSAAHGLYAGQAVYVLATTNTGINGTFTITSVTTDTFSYSQTGTDIPSGADTGTVWLESKYGFYSGTARNYFQGYTDIAVSTARNALTITQTGTGNALVVEDSARPDSTPFVVDATGQVIVGNTSALSNFVAATPVVQIHGTTVNGSSLGLECASTTNAASSTITFIKTAAATINTATTVVAADEQLGTLIFAGSDGVDGWVPAAQIQALVDGTPSDNDMPGRLVFSTTADGASTPTERLRIDSSGNILNRSTGGLGYGTGSGGAVTQLTSRTTGVTLNKTNGAITLVSAAGSTSWKTFTVTNSTVAATDTIIVNQKSGTDLNMIHVTAVAAGSFNITFATTGGTTVEQPVFNFAVIKAVTS